MDVLAGWGLSVLAGGVLVPAGGKVEIGTSRWGASSGSGHSPNTRIATDRDIHARSGSPSSVRRVCFRPERRYSRSAACARSSPIW
jgi:hypothetical protein